jgi:hypothetical protein
MFDSAFLQERHVHTIAVAEFSDPFSWLRRYEVENARLCRIGQRPDRSRE